MKTRSVTLLFAAEIAAMSLWFVSSATLGDISREATLSGQFSAALSSSVPAGFVVGALLIAISGIADLLDPRRVFAVAALLAAVSNFLILWVPLGNWTAVFLRFLIGFFLAGVYPVGMKIVVGWGTRDRGWLVGLTVGGLTLGTAFPHLISFLGGTNWRLTTMLASGLAVLASVLILFAHLGPHHCAASRFRPDAIYVAWSDKRIRMAILGYLGHMWELYAMWSWIATAVAVSYTIRLPPDEAVQFAKLTTFVAIAAGALLCPIAGVYADRIGKARVATIAMAISSLSALAAAASFAGPIWLVAAVVVLWGMSIIPDSAQFSALIADYSPADQAGSIMTLQTALGFALTIVTVQATPFVAAQIGWPWVFTILALGPVSGIVALLRLER